MEVSLTCCSWTGNAGRDAVGLVAWPSRVYSAVICTEGGVDTIDILHDIEFTARWPVASTPASVLNVYMPLQEMYSRIVTTESSS